MQVYLVRVECQNATDTSGTWKSNAILKFLLDAERSVQTLVNKNVVCNLGNFFIYTVWIWSLSVQQVPVAAVVIMACNRPDYLQRTVESILKYALCFHFFILKSWKLQLSVVLFKSLAVPRFHSVDDTCGSYIWNWVALFFKDCCRGAPHNLLLKKENNYKVVTYIQSH